MRPQPSHPSQSLALQLGTVISLHVSVSNHRIKVKLWRTGATNPACRGVEADRPLSSERVHDHAKRRARADNRLTLSVQQQMRQNRRTPRTRPKTIQSDSSITESASKRATRTRGQTNIANPPPSRGSPGRPPSHANTATVLTQHGADHRIQRHVATRGRAHSAGHPPSPDRQPGHPAAARESQSAGYRAVIQRELPS